MSGPTSHDVIRNCLNLDISMEIYFVSKLSIVFEPDRIYKYTVYRFVTLFVALQKCRGNFMILSEVYTSYWFTVIIMIEMQLFKRISDCETKNIVVIDCDDITLSRDNSTAVEFLMLGNLSIEEDCLDIVRSCGKWLISTKFPYFYTCW